MQRGNNPAPGSSMAAPQGSAAAPPRELNRRQRAIVLAAAFSGWMFAGWQISLFVLLARPAMLDLLALHVPASELEGLAGRWFAWFQCAFLLGAASGGWIFGWLGDRIGRTRALGTSILCYALFTGVSYFAVDPATLCALRFFACLGIGGAWPNAVSLAVEALPGLSKPLLAGLMGAAANVGFVMLGLLCCIVPITPDAWRWALVVSSLPALLGVFVLACVPESPRWLSRALATGAVDQSQPMREILRPPLLSRTVIGICLGAIPVIGTSANANWLIPWADQAAERAVESRSPDDATSAQPKKSKAGDPRLKAWTQVTRSGGAVFGSLMGGWLASLLGRRFTYFMISLVSFLTSSYIYMLLDPLDKQFAYFTFLLGFVGVTYFGWLPLYLPELFPTRVRSTGTGVTFNSGRFPAAASVLGAGVLIQLFDGDYARLGTLTGLVYVLGMVVICFAPDTTKLPAED